VIIKLSDTARNAMVDVIAALIDRAGGVSNCSVPAVACSRC
jgi:hypothetical protein